MSGIPRMSALWMRPSARGSSLRAAMIVILTQTSDTVANHLTREDLEDRERRVKLDVVEQL